MRSIILFLIISIGLGASVVIPDRDKAGNILSTSDAFSSKKNYSFRGRGFTCLAIASGTTSCEYAITNEKVRFNGIEIMGGKLGDKANLKILDTASGTYTQIMTGNAIPNFVLDQFGFDWNLKEHTKEILPYPADLNQGMRICVQFINSESVVKNIFINLFLHEF